MRRLLLVLAACSSRTAETRDAMVDVPKVIRGAHGAPIDIVAVTADGVAAATQDPEGNTRLWPSLDGTQEPIVVHASTAEELAILHGENFLIAALDASGDLELVRIAPDGTERSHGQTGDLAVQQIAATTSYLLALRSDQTIAVFDSEGREHGRLAVPSGSRATALVTRGEHARVIVERDGKLYARVLDPDAVTWGQESVRFNAVSNRFALSPDGLQLAMLRGNASLRGNAIDILEMRTGFEQTGCGTTASDTQPQIVPIAFVDNTHLACLSNNQIQWFEPGSRQPTYVHTVLQPELVGVGGSIQVTGDGLALGIATVMKPMHYLGYGLVDPSSLRNGPLGVTVSHNSTPLLLDGALRVKREIAMDATVFEDALPLDTSTVLRTLATGDGHRLVIDYGKRTETVARTSDYVIHFDAATNLLAIRNGERGSLIAYDPIRHRFGDPMLLPGITTKLFLTDPQLSDGVAVVVVNEQGGLASNTRITELRVVRQTVQVIRTYLVSGEVVAVDRAARSYIAVGSSVHVYVAGEYDAPVAVTTIAATGRPVIAIDPSATRALVMSDSRVMLVDLANHVDWSIAAPTAVDVGWIEGKPFVRFGSGFATLDLHTGALLDRACGWQFGLNTSPTETTGATRSVCDAD